MALLFLLLIHTCLPRGHWADEEVVYGIGIKLCNLKCIQRGSCKSFSYDIDRLACHLSHEDVKNGKMKEGSVIYPKMKNQFSAGACCFANCTSNTRCVERRRGGAVCVEEATTTSMTTPTTTAATSTTTTTTCSATTKKSKVTHTYVGCYQDQVIRLLPYQLNMDRRYMTIEACKLGCYRRHHTYFGIEVGQECYCGDFIKFWYVKEPDSECRMPCSGDKSKRTMCGRKWRISIYKIG